MPSYLHVTSVPPGEAPHWVRLQWVGLALPLAQESQAALPFPTFGVLTGPKNVLSCLFAGLTGRLERRSGFLVEAEAAVAILATRNPEAAAWWRANAPHLLRAGRHFVFDQGVGHVNAISAEA